jgi:hypothetical protein
MGRIARTSSDEREWIDGAVGPGRDVHPQFSQARGLSSRCSCGCWLWPAVVPQREEHRPDYPHPTVADEKWMWL